MNDKLKYYLSEIVKEDTGASELAISGLQKQFGFELPATYIEVMKEFNGGEGGVGENGWLWLFSIEELPDLNKDYHSLMEQIPDYFLFGKDAADTGYAFHKKKQSVHSFGLMSDFRVDYMHFCGRNFEEFLERLHSS